MLAETLVKGRQRIETGGERQVVDLDAARCVFQAIEQVLQAGLVDVAVEALAEYLVEQVRDLIAAVTALARYPLQVQFRVEVRLLALEVLFQILCHGAQLPG
ncbi:hypothetical protein D3C72_1842000 [compost metagenome]